MLRNVCDACEEVIDGAPVKKEYPEVVLLIDDEVALMYENICQTCREKLVFAVKNFKNGPRKQLEQEPAIEANAEPVIRTNEKLESREVQPKAVPTDGNDEKRPLENVTTSQPLAEQVVKQYPVRLPQH